MQHMLKTFKADLHIHSCLSPCAELEMSPHAIVRAAIDRKLDIIAVTDHNSAENTGAAQKASAHTDLTVLCGMEVTSSEEAHILGLFDTADSVLQFQQTVYSNLLPGENDETRFGEQIVVNENDEVMGFNRRLLIAATALPAQSIVNTIHNLEGLSVASHIDKDVFSIISQLGFIPDDLRFDALEMSLHMDRDRANSLFDAYRSYAWISSSDAHHLSDIGKRTSTFLIKEPSIKELSLAFQGKEGRTVEWK